MRKVTVSYEEDRAPGPLQIKAETSTGSYTYTALTIVDTENTPHRQNIDKEYFCEIKPNQAAQFIVGDERQLMTGEMSQMASVSPVFQAMFQRAWRDGKDPIEIPDVRPDAFDFLLRHAKGQQNQRLTNSNVWHVLKAADKYQVTPLVSQCFHYLLHRHSCHQRGEHLCLVTETARQLNYTVEYEKCLNKLKTLAGKVFKCASTLALLSYESLLSLVQDDDLRVVDEIAVHEAVMTWVRHKCRQHAASTSCLTTSQPTWEEMRAEAGEIVRHVRYLTMPRASLRRLLKNRTSLCLLTDDEAHDLLYQNGSQFPETVRKSRKGIEPRENQRSVTYLRHFGWCVLIALILLLSFIVQYVCLRFFVIRMMPYTPPQENAVPDNSNQTLPSDRSSV